MLSIKKVKELIKDKNISDDEAEEIRDNMYELASIIFEKWNTERLINAKLLKLIKSRFALDIDSIHGLPHWKRVEKIGNYLANHTGADQKVVKLFAYLHDSKRVSEDKDSGHGSRAALFAQELHKNGLLDISNEQLEQLCFACENHTDSDIKSDDITIQTCWDADRLDLWRVGIIPDKKFLNTDIAKRFDLNKKF